LGIFGILHYRKGLELRGFAPIGMLEYWNVGILGDLVLLHIVQDKFTT